MPIFCKIFDTGTQAVSAVSGTELAVCFKSYLSTGNQCSQEFTNKLELRL